MDHRFAPQDGQGSDYPFCLTDGETEVWGERKLTVRGHIDGKGWGRQRISSSSLGSVKVGICGLNMSPGLTKQCVRTGKADAPSLPQQSCSPPEKLGAYGPGAICGYMQGAFWPQRTKD